MNRSDLAMLFDRLNIETQARVIRGAEAAKKTVADYLVFLLAEGVNTYAPFIRSFGVNT